MDFETLVPQNTGGGGGGGASYTEVNAYADLPSAASVSGEVYLVLTSTGFWPMRRYAGLWKSNGVSWTWLGNFTWVGEEIGYTAGGGIVATDIQGAIAELDSEKLASSAVSAFGLTLVDDADAVAARATLGLGPGALLSTQDLYNLAGLKATYRSQAWYGPNGAIESNDAYTPITDTIEFFTWPLLGPALIDRLQFGINTGATAGHATQVGIWEMGPNGYPIGAPVFDSGSIATITNTNYDITGLSLALNKGRYWYGFCANNGTYRFRRSAITVSTLMRAMTLGNNNPSSGAYSLRKAHTFGTALPTLTDSSGDFASLASVAAYASLQFRAT